LEEEYLDLTNQLTQKETDVETKKSDIESKKSEIETLEWLISLPHHNQRHHVA